MISTITEAAPFLARFYAILKQSSVKLRCLNGKMGESFMNFLDYVSYFLKNVFYMWLFIKFIWDSLIFFLFFFERVTVVQKNFIHKTYFLEFLK